MLFGKNVNKYYLKYFYLFLTGIIALIAVDYIQLLIPENYSSLIDQINYKTLTSASLAKIISNMIFIGMGMFIGRFLWRLSVLNLGVKVEASLRERMFKHMEELSQDYFQINKTGAQMALYTNDLMCVKDCFTDGIIMLIDAFFMGGLAIYKMLKQNIFLTVISSIPLVVLGVFGLFIGRAIDKKFSERQEAFEKMSDFTQENFSGISVIKAFVKEKLEFREFAKNNDEFSNKNVSFSKFAVGLRVLFSLMINLILIIIIGYGSYLIKTTKGSSNEFTPGMLILFISYFGQLTWPALALANLINLTSQGRASLRRINELLNYKVMVKDSKDVVRVEKLEGNIEFKNLSFKYPGSDVEVLNNISLKINKGEKVGIIGRTGCGKTTIVDILVRMYNVDEGTLFIDGIDVNYLPIRQVRNLISYVPQDNFLFNESVFENISFSNKNMSLNDAKLFAKYACVNDNIEDFPKKYDTIIGERGVTLSGGQKQRISMARAMARQSNVLILDDSVSAVDTDTEARILKTLKEEFSDKTIIMIAHRVSTIDTLDKIVLVDDGKIVAVGKHEDLYKNVLMYKDIVDLQKLEGGNE